MRKEFDFSKGKRGLYKEKLERGKITIGSMMTSSITSKRCQKKGVPYQTPINIYLQSCKNNELEVNLERKKRA